MSEAPLIELAEVFASETIHPASSWELVLREQKAEIREARLRREDLIELAGAVEAPSDLAGLVRLLARCPGVHPEQPHPLDELRERMGDFSFSFAAWLRSIRQVQQHAENHSVPGTFAQYLEFVSCCAEYASRQAMRTDLSATTDELLVEFGFTGESSHDASSVS